MTHYWIYACLGAFILCGVPSQSFSPTTPSPFLGGTTISSNSFQTPQISILRGTPDDDDDAEGGTAWIKDAMGSEEGNVSSASSPPSNGSPGFTQDEIDDMDQLIVSISKESDDEKRRKKLADILDKELTEASNADDAAFDSEIPKFATLFQLSLDNIGEQVQTAAREAALEQQQQNLSNGDDGNDASNDVSEGGERIQRVKSPEELQLWALIDMMVQSKTRVKLHMGSLGSKGEFR